jgi:hypothetical protein
MKDEEERFPWNGRGRWREWNSENKRLLQTGYVGADCSTEEDEDEKRILPKWRRCEEEYLKVIHNQIYK